MPDIFLSYSSDDRDTARRFAEGFERAGFSVWWDQTLRTGEAFDQVIEAALKEARAVVVLWSTKSVDSRWVRAEATVGDRNGTLVPVAIESCQRPVMFELTHTADLSQWKGDPDHKAWRALVEDVRRHAGNGRMSPAAEGSAPTLVPAKHHRRFIAGIALLALLIVGVGSWALLHERGDVPGHAATTLAVLPFTDMSPAHDQEYFSDGLSEEILNKLAQIKRLTVAARTSSFAFKGHNEDMRVIGRKLGVANLLEGSIRKDGSKLRITAQLIESGSGTHLWSKSYDREMSKVFAVQEEIAKDVAQALSVKLDVGELSRADGGTTNVEAYEAYLSGIALAYKPEVGSVLAAERFRQAVVLDPSFYLAWLWLGSVHVNHARQTGKDVPQEATTAYERARSLRPDSLNAYFYSGYVDELNLAWGSAARRYRAARSIADRKGLDTNENDVTEASLLLAVGKVREAVSLLQRVKMSGAPDDATWAMIAESHLYSGDSAAAMANREEGLRQTKQPTFRQEMLMTALSTRDRAQIDKWIDAAFNPGESQHLSSEMKPLLDRPKEALARLRQLAAEAQYPGQRWRILYWVAYFHDPETALRLLQGISSAGGVSRVYIVWSIWDPLMNDVRKLPGFKDLVRDMKLVEYWKEYGWGDFCKPISEDDFECQ